MSALKVKELALKYRSRSSKSGAYEEDVGRSGKKVSGSGAAKPGLTLAEGAASDAVFLPKANSNNHCVRSLGILPHRDFRVHLSRALTEAETVEAEGEQPTVATPRNLNGWAPRDLF
jgi:hypothetical protein